MPVYNFGAIMDSAAQPVREIGNAFMRTDMLRQRQQQVDAEEAAWEQAVQSKNVEAMARIDPEATRLLVQHWQDQAGAGLYAPQITAEKMAIPKVPGTITEQRLPSGRVLAMQDGNPVGSPWEPPSMKANSADSGQFRVLSPEQVKALGFPEGAVVQSGPNGKLDVVSSKPQQTLTPKDASAAQVKLRQIQLAKKQLALVRAKFGALKNTFSSGPGGKYLPSESGKQADAAVNSMRDTLTSITRVPGIGAMSDYETRLQQAKFPDRGQYESVSDQQIQSLQDTLDLLENGYQDMLNGGTSSASQAPAAPSGPQAPQAAIDYLKSHPETKAAFFKKYGYLP